MAALASIEEQLNPFPLYQTMRRSQPVYYDRQRQNWNIFRYDDVQRVLSDYSLFSSKFAGDIPDSADEPFAASMIATDPPRHRQLRSLVTQAFTPKAVDALAPRITEIVHHHLDQVMAGGGMDVIQDLGYPLPVIVIAELLGIPTEDRERFKTWSDVIVSLADLGGNVDYAAFNNSAVLEMSAYFFNMIEKRRQEPGDDLISGLLAAEVDGQKLSLVELLGFCALLLVAGNETTTNLIGNGMLTFSEHPEAWEHLRKQPDLLAQAIEEVLRYRSPVQAMFRVTTQEVELAGQVIPAHAPLVAWIGAANHDEGQFTDPEKFDIARAPNRHLAFGQGIHYCLGAPLARLEARIAFQAMLERFDTVELAQDIKLERLPSLIVYGVRSLPISFTQAR